MENRSLKLNKPDRKQSPDSIQRPQVQRVLSVPLVVSKAERFLTPRRSVDNLKKWAADRQLTSITPSSKGDTDELVPE